MIDWAQSKDNHGASNANKGQAVTSPPHKGKTSRTGIPKSSAKEYDALVSPHRKPMGRAQAIFFKAFDEARGDMNRIERKDVLTMGEHFPTMFSQICTGFGATLFGALVKE